VVCELCGKEEKNVRARSLKPSIFKNELLAVADPLFTVIFEGLWCAADREGRLEDRPGKLHIEINPGRAFDGTERALAWLAENGFILRYVVAGKKYIHVIEFTKHQKPHVNEKPSVIPAPVSTQGSEPVDLPEVSGTTKVASEHNQGDKHLALTPDSGLLTPSSLTPDSLIAAATQLVSREPLEWFLQFRREYPERSGDPDWRGAQKAANARIREGHTPEQFISGAKRYAMYCAATEKLGTEFVKQAATFLGPAKPFLLPWTPPVPKAARQLDSNISAGLAFLAGGNS
jgi:hypothetical protein